MLGYPVGGSGVAGLEAGLCYGADGAVVFCFGRCYGGGDLGGEGIRGGLDARVDKEGGFFGGLRFRVVCGAGGCDTDLCLAVEQEFQMTDGVGCFGDLFYEVESGVLCGHIGAGDLELLVEPGQLCFAGAVGIVVDVEGGGVIECDGVEGLEGFEPVGNMCFVEGVLI